MRRILYTSTLYNPQKRLTSFDSIEESDKKGRNLWITDSSVSRSLKRIGLWQK